MARGFQRRSGMPGMGGGFSMDMIRQAQKMQEDMAQLQAETEAKEYTAAAGGGVVTATVTGKRELKTLQVDPEVFADGDVEFLQDMVIAAVNEALRAAEKDMSAQMEKLTGGLQIPF